MASVIRFEQIRCNRYRAGMQADHSALRAEVAKLNVGEIWSGTFSGRYSARCARHALTHYCRVRLRFTVEAHQTGNTLEIRRVK
jgi:hypothetical protein